ncbi:hypothetical protein FQR65_LT20731 [Abscondita terminalis]|nr:hypothetical protein FQR65_LT20731 [Abscondita terminalis]
MAWRTSGRTWSFQEKQAGNSAVVHLPLGCSGLFDSGGAVQQLVAALCRAADRAHGAAVGDTNPVSWCWWAWPPRTQSLISASSPCRQGERGRRPLKRVLEAARLRLAADSDRPRWPSIARRRALGCWPAALAPKCGMPWASSVFAGNARGTLFGPGADAGVLCRDTALGPAAREMGVRHAN